MSEDKIKDAKDECKINLWIMLIGCFVIGLNFMFGSLLGHFEVPAFIFISSVYAVMILFIHLMYNPIGRFKFWLKNRK